MSWRHDIENAPRGQTAHVTRNTKDGPIQVPTFKRDVVILATKCGKVTQSYWLPEEKRWCMLSAHEEPEAWMAWPEHPTTPTHISARKAG